MRAGNEFRKLRGEDSTGVFYRPGIGYGGALYEVLEKIGTYQTMIVSDPVYEGSEMDSWSEGLLPINYYVKTLNLLEPQSLQVSLTDNFQLPDAGRVLTVEQIEDTKIPRGGMATINFRVNGVDLTLHLLAEDMTKFNPSIYKLPRTESPRFSLKVYKKLQKTLPSVYHLPAEDCNHLSIHPRHKVAGFSASDYNILGLGRPTPYNPDKAKDPRYSEPFHIQAIQDLALNGLIDYYEGDFTFLPKVLPPEVFRLRIVYQDQDEESLRRVVQKSEDVGERLRPAFRAVEAVNEALGALAGNLPGENWMGYFRNFGKYSQDKKDISLDDVVTAYKGRLEEISRFIDSLPDQTLQNAVLKRIEFLFMGPLATDNQLDIDKIMKIHETPQDPDKPTKENEQSSQYPYFGDPHALIQEHNAGTLDIFEYYEKLGKEFYAIFPQLRKSK